MTKLNPLLSSNVNDNMRKFTGQNREKILDIFFIKAPQNYSFNLNYLIIPNNHSDHYPILYDFMPMRIVT